MNIEAATNQQLWTIIQDDIDCPKDLMEQVVLEGFKRNLFDHLVKHLINKLFPRWADDRKYRFEDLKQMGLIGVVMAMNYFKPGSGSFKTLAYMNIKSEFLHHLDKVFSEKRKVYNNMCSIDIQRDSDTDETFADALIDFGANVEKAAIAKIFWDDNFRKLDEKEKGMLRYFSEGYSYNEIAEKYNYKSSAIVHRILHKAFKKINPDREKNNLKSAGLMTMHKKRGLGA